MNVYFDCGILNIIKGERCGVIHNTEEDKVVQKRKERLSLCAMSACMVLLGLVIWATVARYGVKVSNVIVYILLFALSFRYTGFFRFLTPRRRYGIVKDIKISRGMYVPKVSGTGGFHGSGVTYVMDCTVVITFDNGKEREFDFVYDGAIKKLKLGDRIGIFRFLKMPVWEINPQ